MQLICTFVFAYAKSGLSHDVAQIIAGYEKTCFMPYENNQSAGQSARPGSLIGAFAVCYLDNKIQLNFKIISESS